MTATGTRKSVTERGVLVEIGAIDAVGGLLLYPACLKPCSDNLHTGPPAKGDKFRDRSRSPFRNGTRDRTRSPPRRGSRTDRKDDRREGRPHERARNTNGRADSHHLSPTRHRDQMDVDPAEVDGEEELEELIRKNMGFTKFRSTKNTKVPGNNIYGVRKEKKTEYRQYMNRTGGFNRPLSPTR